MNNATVTTVLTDEMIREAARPNVIATLALSEAWEDAMTTPVYINEEAEMLAHFRRDQKDILATLAAFWEADPFDWYYDRYNEVWYQHTFVGTGPRLTLAAVGYYRGKPLPIAANAIARSVVEVTAKWPGTNPLRLINVLTTMQLGDMLNTMEIEAWLEDPDGPPPVVIP